MSVSLTRSEETNKPLAVEIKLEKDKNDNKPSHAKYAKFVDPIDVNELK